MAGGGLWFRVFLGLLLAVLLPMILLVGAVLLTGSVLRTADPSLVATLVLIGAILWAAVLAVVYTRVLGEDIQSLVAFARRGGSGAGGQDPDGPYLQLATSLTERDRQVAALAEQSSIVPIDDDPARVAGSLVAATRTVLRDPTWRLAVLDSADPDLLAPGVYRVAGEDPALAGVGEMERWAAATNSEEPARYLEGPWGAFCVIDMSAPDRFRASLYAPWEGRTPPSPAETALLRLVGQHASTALEHAFLYRQVHAQTEELNRLAAIQADFLRGVTHDLQTPLTSIGALATELRANADVPDTARADLDSISHQADRLRRMVSQLLIASRLEAGALTPQQDVFAVVPLIERTWAALRAARPFELRVDPAPYLAVGDSDRLEQVLWAVLDNAVKYSPAASRITVDVHPDGPDLVISVRDHGMGMDEEARVRAFEQFYRSAPARRVSPDGSGVGLYAAKGLMGAMGGSITIETQLGAGTAVTIRIPAEPSAPSGE